MNEYIEPFSINNFTQVSRMQAALDAAEIGLWELDVAANKIHLCQRSRTLLNLKSHTVPYTDILELIAADQREEIDSLFRRALQRESAGNFEAAFCQEKGSYNCDRWFQWKGTACFDEQGNATGFSGSIQNIKSQVPKQSELHQSAIAATPEISMLHALIQQAPVAIALYSGRKMKIEMANDVRLRYWGKDQRVIGQLYQDAELDFSGQSFFEILDGVYTSGEMYESKSTPALVNVNGELKTEYFDFSYKPLKNDIGQTYAVMSMAVEVTSRVQTDEALKASEGRLRSVIESAPMAIGLFAGRDQLIELSNQTFIDVVGKGPGIIGLPLRQAMPELEGQKYLNILDEVYNSGVAYQCYGTQMDILQKGIMSHNYYNLTYSPLFDKKGNVYAILHIGVDVTGQVLDQQKSKHAKSMLRGAVELAELGTYQIDLATGVLECSERIKEWFGLKGEHASVETLFAHICESDREAVIQAVNHALTPESNGQFDMEYSIDAAINGFERILHAQGRTFFNEKGEAETMIGTAKDITLQRKTTLALEIQVQQRTQQLKAMNDELSESNSLLLESNMDLEKFAFVASHDLQEPLRKIQLFSGLLVEQYAPVLGEGVHYLLRLQAAVSRMSDQVRDLLNLSRVSDRIESWKTVSLTSMVNLILADLQVLIQESEATIRVEPLPTIQGDAFQLEQLFLNLISNSIKFRRKNTPVHINITTRIVPIRAFRPILNSVREASQYCQIDITDNGIGFEMQYSERIFELFQKLHRGSEYAGSGIGLAVCKKVVKNHGGAISAFSEPGKGSTFSIYLPISK